METIKIIKNRRSVRNYIDKPIPKEVLEDIVDCARLAPSAHNKQPWKFVIITKKEKLTAISQAASWGSFIKDAAACIIVCGNVNEEHLIEDGCAATENILLAAKAHGIGTCWVAGWKRSYDEAVRKVIKAPKNVYSVSIISLGYPDDEPPMPRKRELKDVIHWESF